MIKALLNGGLWRAYKYYVAYEPFLKSSALTRFLLGLATMHYNQWFDKQPGRIIDGWFWIDKPSHGPWHVRIPVTLTGWLFRNELIIRARLRHRARAKGF